MSYNTNRRDALDLSLPLKYRVSHARSCAMLIGQKWGVHRSEVIEAVKSKCGVNLHAVAFEHEVEMAIRVLEELRTLGMPTSSD